MTAKKVLIVTISPQDPSRPPGILSVLAGCCESIGVEYALLDLNLYMYKTYLPEITDQLITDLLLSKFRSAENLNYFHQMCQHLVETIKIEKPTHLAISIFTYANIFSADILLKYLRDADIDVNYEIVIGGLGIYSSKIQEVTKNQSFGEYCKENQLVDYCIYGEGEIAFVELLKGNVNYPGIDHTNAKQIMDLDSIPQPSYQKINPSEYFYSNAPEVLVTGSRGCVKKCTFCDVVTYWNKYVYKSGRRMAEEIFNIWKTTGVQKFDFSDSLINGSIKSFREFNQALIEYRKSNPEFKPLYKGQFICRPEGQLKEQDYAEMSQAGVETLVIGIESFSEQVRNHMKKKFSNQDADWHFEMSAKYGIKNVLLLLSGYVTETLEDHKINLEYLKKYQKYALSRIIYAINIEINGLAISPAGTPLNDMIDELGIHFYNDATSGTMWTTTANPGLTPKERLRRGTELVISAYDHGFKVVHFDQKVDSAEQQFKKIQEIEQQKIFKIELQS